jgi:hypothetical protein
MNLFANCVLVLDATTGKRQWHYQTVHHDIFDYDDPPAPILATITVGGVVRDVAVQLTKMGLTFVLDRVINNSRPRPTAMVVAKDPSLRGLTSAILRQKGFAVREAPSLESEEEVFAGCGESLSLLVVNTDGHDQELMLGVIKRLRIRMDEIRVVLTSASSPEPLDL